MTQVMACALVALTGYAIGAIIEGVVSALVRAALNRRDTRNEVPLPTASTSKLQRLRRHRSPMEWTRIGITCMAILGAAAFTPDGVRWQIAQRQATDVPGSAPSSAIVIIATLALCLIVLWLARLLRKAGRGFARLIGRRTSWPFAVRTLLGGTLVLCCGVLVAVIGLAISNVAFEKLNDQTPATQAAPTSTDRSGGPDSLIPWQSLGIQGRWFVQQGPIASQITTVTGKPAVEPIRIFAGLESADGLQNQANLAVADLKRAGAFSRKHVVVYTPSTNGYVDSSAAAAAEYVTGGDVASVSMQYTVLPSFLSIALSQSQSLDSGTILLNTVRAAINELPVASRPKVYVYGESLGAFGSAAPFAGKGTTGLVDQVDGALWAGPPANTTYWDELSSQARGGPAWAPYLDDGAVVRFAANAEGLTQPSQRWGSKRGVFLQNATDPVVWWSPSLIASRPAWLDSPRGPGVPTQMTWVPLATFEQVLVDMPAAGAMPAGVGHNYLPSVGPGWVAILQPPGWTSANQQKLDTALTMITPTCSQPNC